MKQHKISWLNVPGYIPQTWNPIIGCSKVSEGCRNCYAERMAFRLAMMALKNPVAPLESYRAAICNCKWTGQTYLVNEALQKPLGWKKPRAIFVNSMGDLFHENTPDKWIDRVFDMTIQCDQHLFIVLTKRAERMRKYFERKACGIGAIRPYFPLPNVWLGVTAENQAAADERIPHLLRTPAAVRFVSCEPLIGAVSLRWAKWHDYTDRTPGYCHDHLDGARDLNWIICGGESGPGARPMNPDWARALRYQAQSAYVPFFFKQWSSSKDQRYLSTDDATAKALGKPPYLDGQKHHQWPEVTK